MQILFKNKLFLSQAVADRDVPCISAGHRVPLMPRGVNNLPCGRVEPALKVLQPADAPSQMTRSLMELARLVDNPPVVEQNVLPPVLRSHNSSKTQQCKVSWHASCTVQRSIENFFIYRKYCI